MINVLRKFLRPTLREQLEDGVRDALRRFSDRHIAPHLRVYVSTDLVEEGVDPSVWALDEGEHLRRFALQWAEDNNVPRAGLRVDMIMLDTKREFAFVKPVLADAPAAQEPVKRKVESPSTVSAPLVAREPASGRGKAVLEVVESPSVTAPLEIAGEVTVGRRTDGAAVVGLGDRYMSARHARFHISGGRLYVTDLDSRNRTYVNDLSIPPHEPVPAAVGDRIRLGTTTYRVARIGD